MSIALVFFASCLALSAFASEQTVLSPDSPFEVELVESNPDYAYSAVLFYGTKDYDDGCFDPEEYDGILFTDIDGVVNYCLRVDSETKETYFKAVMEDGSEKSLYDLGDFVSSFRVVYDFLHERVYIARAESYDETTIFKAKYTNRVSSIFLTSFFSNLVEGESFSDYSPFLTSWRAHNQEYSTETLELSQGDSDCTTPDFGLLEGVEICVEYDSDGYIEVTADSVSVFSSTLAYSYDEIIVSYTDLNNIISFSGSDEDEDIFYLTTLEVMLLVNEGETSTGSTSTIEFEVSNDEASSYDCINLRNSVYSNSELYPTFEALCLTCDEKQCELSVLLLQEKSELTIRSFDLEDDSEAEEESVSYSYNLDEDLFTVNFHSYCAEDDYGDTFTSTLYGGQLVMWSQNKDDDFTYADLNDDLILEYTPTESYYGVNGTFTTVSTIQFENFNEDYGVYCETSKCYLGLLNDEDEIEVVKEYAGNYENFRVYKITDQGAVQYCLSFEDENLVKFMNDCGLENEWLFYQQYKTQYPDSSVQVAQWK